MKIVGVIGASRCDERVERLAYDVGKGIAEAGCALICGGLTGVMEGACHGAHDAGGLTIGVLPGEHPEAANPYVALPIVTGMGVARNVIIVRSASVVIAVAGGPGTLSEIAFALQLHVPVIGLETWEVAPDVIRAASPRDAVARAIEHFDKT